MSSRKSCRSIVNLRAFMSPSPRHSPPRLATTVSCIESRDGDASLFLCTPPLTPESTRRPQRSEGVRTSPRPEGAFLSQPCRISADETRRSPGAPLVRALERDEIRVVGEWGGAGCGIAGVPGVDHPLMDGADGVLVGGSLSCYLRVHTCSLVCRAVSSAPFNTKWDVGGE